MFLFWLIDNDRVGVTRMSSSRRRRVTKREIWDILQDINADILHIILWFMIMNSIIKPVNQDVISISAVLTWLLSVILIINIFFLTS